jgi:transaldolase
MSRSLIHLDSASLSDIAAAMESGFVTGVTTNPKLMRIETFDPLAHLRRILKEFDAIDVYYQPTGYDEDHQSEASTAVSIASDRVVVKVPATTRGIALASNLITQGARVSLTAAQYPEAMLLAEAAGCESVIPYVDRAQRDPSVPSRLVASLAKSATVTQKL